MADEPKDNMNAFTPWQSVGEFHLESNIGLYQFPNQQWNYYPKDEFGVESYRAVDGSISIYFQDSVIIHIFCHDTLIYHSTNLIGLTIDEFRQITQSDYVGEIDVIDFEDDGYPQNVYEFESIGAQVWEKQGKIVTIVVAGKDSYSDEPYED